MDLYTILMMIVLFTPGKTQEYCEGNGENIICYNINQQNVYKLSDSRTYYSCCGNNILRNYDYFYLRKSNIKIIPINMCYGGFYGILLEDVGIERISSGAFDNQKVYLRYLYLRKNHLKKINYGIFNTLKKIEIIELQHNQIEEIEEQAFTGLNALRILLLNNNNISKLPSNVFDLLSNLTYLDISYNNINTLDHSLLMSNNILTSLFASHNNITELPENLFINNINLSSIDLSYNPINHINYNLFLNLRNFHVLNLTFTQQKSMFLLDKAGTVGLTQLVLDKNNINELNITSTNLTSLSLAVNNLNILNSTTFQHCVYLTYLNLSINNINKVEKTAFVHVTSLETLDLSYNKIEILPYGLFSTLLVLKYLDISSNSLKVLPYGIFDSLKNLKSLNVSSNQISFYAPNSMKKLKTFYLDNNNIEYLDGAEIASQFESLELISLDNNLFICSNLMKLVHTLEKRSIKVNPGNTLYTTNVNQIKCSDPAILKDIENNTKNFNDTDVRQYVNKIFSSMNDSFYGSSFYSFFNDKFKESKFYKYFENIKAVSNISNVNDIIQESVESCLLAVKEKRNQNDHLDLNIVLYLICITVVAIFLLTAYKCLNSRNSKRTLIHKGFVENQTELSEVY